VLEEKLMLVELGESLPRNLSIVQEKSRNFNFFKTKIELGLETRSNFLATKLSNLKCIHRNTSEIQKKETQNYILH
jgi:hypothetical protein